MVLFKKSKRKRVKKMCMWRKKSRTKTLSFSYFVHIDKDSKLEFASFYFYMKSDERGSLGKRRQKKVSRPRMWPCRD